MDIHRDGQTETSANKPGRSDLLPQVRDHKAEDASEYDQGYVHSHIDENGHIYTHCHKDEHTRSQKDRHGHSHKDGHGHTHSHIDENGHVYTHSHGDAHDHGHHHVHSDQEKKAVLNRLSRAIGHLESVKRMVERDEDCSEVLIQLSAVRNAINNTGKVIIKNHISHCLVEAIEQDDLEAVDALNHAIDHFIK